MIKIFLLISCFGLLLGLEAWQPFLQKIHFGMMRKINNLSLAGLNGILSFIMVVPISLYISNLFDFRGDLLPDYLWLGLDLLLLDLWIYFWHRANHELPFLWRFHQIHHYDKRLDVTSALRFHFGEVFLSALVRILPILIFDIPFAHIVIFESLILMASLFQHSNIALPQKIQACLMWFIVTPAWHFVHHHNIHQDTDSNYGTILTLWDRLFKSKSPNQAYPTMEIGIEGIKQDLNLGKLLMKPFIK